MSHTPSGEQLHRPCLLPASPRRRPLRIPPPPAPQGPPPRAPAPTSGRGPSHAHHPSPSAHPRCGPPGPERGKGSALGLGPAGQSAAARPDQAEQGGTAVALHLVRWADLPAPRQPRAVHLRGWARTRPLDEALNHRERQRIDLRRAGAAAVPSDCESEDRTPSATAWRRVPCITLRLGRAIPRDFHASRPPLPQPEHTRRSRIRRRAHRAQRPARRDPAPRRAPAARSSRRGSSPSTGRSPVGVVATATCRV